MHFWLEQVQIEHSANQIELGNAAIPYALALDHGI